MSKRIKEILIKYDNVLELLKEIPGFNTKVVEDLVSEIGLDISAPIREAFGILGRYLPWQ